MTPVEVAVGGIIAAAIVIAIFVLNKRYQAKLAKERKERAELLAAAAAKDRAWDPQALEARVREVFFAFQKAWSDLDTETMKGLLTERYFRRMVLELTVLTNLKRRNLMEDVNIRTVEIISLDDAGDDAKDRFDAAITASAKDSIVETTTGKTLHTDRSAFTEYWRFMREDGAWKLDVIRQETEDASYVERGIEEFATRNGFFYDPDFGWLMMPDKGVLFGKYRFGKADINNHVVGYHRGKVVEFYTYVSHPDERTDINHLVAQAVLPIEHHDILVRKRHWMMDVPKGLTEITLAFGDFNKKFQVCADPRDNVTTFELLTTNFMAKLYDLPFDLNVEVVGNVLYLYTPKRDVSYEQMLEVLSWAFDEMKM